MNRTLYRVLPVVALLFIAASAQAVTHCVPSAFSGSCDDSHATIQAALDDAVNGDTILVAPGTYAENLSVDVDVTIQGAQVGVDARGRVTGAPNPATESIIAPAAGLALTLLAGSGGTTIDGFSFLGGTRSIESMGGPLNNLLIQNNHFAGFTNAGVFLNDPGIDITITRNVLDAASKVGGGGIFHLDTDNFAGFRFEDNIVRNGGTGTGLFVDGNNNVGPSINRAPRLAGNLIIDNNTGINLGSRSFESGTIENNTFESNNFDGLQGGPQNSTIQNNIFRGNGRSGLALTSFGNLAADRGAQNLTIMCNAFLNNVSEGILFSATQAPGTIATNVANNNNIAGNTNGAFYNGTETINVESNWWGAATGPTVASNPGGTGDTLAGTGAAFFDYMPFLTSTALCVPGQPPPDLTIAKMVSNATPQEGEAITFTITLTNIGGPGTLVSVTDMLPAGLTFVSATPSQGTYTAGTGTWDVGTATSPDVETLQIVATVNAGTAGSTITNTATITGSTPADSTPANNTASAMLTVAQPNLAIAKTANDTTPEEGATVTFTIVVTNSGTAGATSVTVTDLLPAGVTFVSSTPSQGTYTAGTGVWDVGGVAAAGTASLQIVATVNAGTAGTTITNTATITASTPADATPGNNTDSEALMVGQPDLSITKTASSTTVPQGLPVTFTIVVATSGNGTATSVTVTDVLPAGLTFISSNASQGTYDAGTGIWNVGAIAAGGSATLEIMASVDGAVGSSAMNTATITASTPPDATPGNNSDSETVIVLVEVPAISAMGLMMLSVLLAGAALVALRR